MYAIFPSKSPSSSHWNLVFPTSFHIDWITPGGTGTTRKATCLARNCISFSHIRPHWYCWSPQVLSRWLFLTFIKKCHRDTPGMSDLLQRSTMHIPKKPTTFPTSCFRGSSLLQENIPVIIISKEVSLILPHHYGTQPPKAFLPLFQR